ncbi:MAG TPA: hypothetical protein VK452_01445 [Dissulfurispiraceae bacterium]|nr:hypothetical protein [Dissulfurispiraceae bacterium]
MATNIHTITCAVVTLFLVGLVANVPCPAHDMNDMQALENSQSEEPAVVLRNEPTVIKAGENQTLTISLTDSSGNPLHGLTVTHDRIMHVIIVSRDFTVFSHIHPEDFGPITDAMKESAKYPVHYIFPKAGSYIIGVDFAYKDRAYSRHFVIDALGEKPVGSASIDLTRKKKFGTYDVTLTSSPEAVSAGKEVMLTYSFAKNGEPVTDLEPYLSAYMHAAIISSDFQYFMHEHGMAPGMAEHVHHMMMHNMSIPEKFGPVLELRVTFPSSGVYEIFGEVKHEGKVILTSFMVEVK